MKKSFVVLVIILVILVLGFLGWQFLSKKSIEGESCKSEKDCQEGLECVINICSSGKVSSVCLDKADCLTPFCVGGKCTEGKRGDSCVSKTDCSTDYCVSGKCTEGKDGDICLTYHDCQKGLFCKERVCSEPPSYSQYFDEIVISKMKIGMPPGPDNIPVPTTEFETTDAIEIDFVGVKPTTVGEFYYEVIDSVTGEVVFTTLNQKQKLEGESTGTGSDLPRVIGEGEFEFNIYYNDGLVYTAIIKVTE